MKLKENNGTSFKIRNDTNQVGRTKMNNGAFFY